MPRIVPSQVRTFMEKDDLLSKCISQDPKSQPDLGSVHTFELSALTTR